MPPALYHADELKGSTLHQVDTELHRKFAGLVPGTVSITGYSELIAEHVRTTSPRTVTTLSSTGMLPFVSGKQLLARIDRLRVGLDFTDQEAFVALRQLLGPDRTMWLNPADRFKLSNQIKDICMALNRRDIFEDFSNTSSVAALALTPPPTGMGMWNFVYQIVLGYELHLRLEKEGGGWYSGVNDKVSANMLISKQWINNVEMFTGGDSKLEMRSRVQARQIDGLLRFAEIMEWPQISEMRDYVENVYVDFVGGKTVTVDLWEWLFGIMLPGKFYASKIMSALVTATPSLGSYGAIPYVNLGFNLQGRSWWRCRNILGSVLAGVHGVKSVCGWIGPCPGVTEPPENPWIRIRARPVEFLRGTVTDPLGNIDDASDDGSGEEAYDTTRRLFSPRAGETVFDVIQDLSDMSLWNEPVPPPKAALTPMMLELNIRHLSNSGLRVSQALRTLHIPCTQIRYSFRHILALEHMLSTVEKCSDTQVMLLLSRISNPMKVVGVRKYW
ncbi:hypothetical protein PILCRDRAFT_322985 [Piloderma croceum F 1598]|uniref:Uncharacterized protein n=1 Tax=Piloderma croceum (strain F 1598) TaxID=765440 RepID=A0A0C3BJ50_PILCF|nr:hypothetical protein PILCRDRAFT_322985 [Piloderma croceum F 1598]